MSDRGDVSRLLWLDAAKAVAIVFVIVGHVSRGLFDSGVFTDGSAFGVVDTSIYLFHMPAFFLISGVLFRPRDWPTFASRSAWNIVLPYFLWATVIIVMQIALSSAANANVGPERILTLPYAPYSIFWFLYALLLIQVAAQMILPLANGSMMLFGLGVVTLVVRYVVAPEGEGIVYSAATFLVYFAAGYLLREEIRRDRSNGMLALGCLAAFIVLDVILVWAGVQVETLGGRLGGLTLAFLFMGVFIFAPQFPLWAGLHRIGQATIAIYCMHTIFTAGTRAVLVKVGIDSVAVHFVLGSAAGLVGPLVALEIARLMHLQKYLGFGSAPTPRRQALAQPA